MSVFKFSSRVFYTLQFGWFFRVISFVLNHIYVFFTSTLATCISGFSKRRYIEFAGSLFSVRLSAGSRAGGGGLSRS